MVAQPFQRNAAVQVGTIGVVPLGSFSIPANAWTNLWALVQPAIRAQVTDIQSVWCDATAAYDQVVIRNAQTRQYVIFAPGSYGWDLLMLRTDAALMEVYCFSATTISLTVTSAVVAPQRAQGLAVRSSPYSNFSIVASVNTATTLLAANPARHGFAIFNDSTQILRVLLTDTANATVSSSNVTKNLAAAEYYVGPSDYGGVVQGIWAAVNGNARITEFV